MKFPRKTNHAFIFQGLLETFGRLCSTIISRIFAGFYRFHLQIPSIENRGCEFGVAPPGMANGKLSGGHCHWVGGSNPRFVQSSLKLLDPAPFKPSTRDGSESHALPQIELVLDCAIFTTKLAQVQAGSLPTFTPVEVLPYDDSRLMFEVFAYNIYNQSA